MPRTKLTNESVAGIRLGYSEGMSLGELAFIYGVSRTQIFRIVHRLQRNSSPPKPSLRSVLGGGKRVNDDLPELVRG